MGRAEPGRVVIYAWSARSFVGLYAPVDSQLVQHEVVLGVGTCGADYLMCIN